MTANPHRLVLDPTAQLFLESIEGRPTAVEHGPKNARVGFDALQGSCVSAAVVEQVVTVDAGSFGLVQVRIVRRVDSLSPQPAVVYLHGGGWVAGSAQSHARLVAELAMNTGAALVFPEYALAPEKRYPMALEQAYATARWVASDGHRHGLDRSRMAVAGDSAGAHIAIGLVLLSLSRNHFRFSQLVAFTPVTDTAYDMESCHRFAEGYFLRRDDLLWCRDQYLPDREKHTDPTASPLGADEADLARFPASLIITAEADVVRDQGEAFAARLREAGAATTAVRYEGTIHGFVALDALRDTSASRAALAQAATALRTSLGDGPKAIR